MKNTLLKTILASAITLSAVTATTPVFADNGFYTGIGVTQAFVDERGLDEDDTGGKIYGGYKFNDYFSIEGSYYDFGNIEDAGRQLEADGVSLAIIGSLPLTQYVSIFAKAGTHDWDAEARGVFPGQSLRDSDTDAFYGAGVQYNFTDSITVRAEVERYEVEELDFDAATIGIQFNF